MAASQYSAHTGLSIEWTLKFISVILINSIVRVPPARDSIDFFPCCSLLLWLVKKTFKCTYFNRLNYRELYYKL